jgi:hypothetical protein
MATGPGASAEPVEANSGAEWRVDPPAPVTTAALDPGEPARRNRPQFQTQGEPSLTSLASHPPMGEGAPAEVRFEPSEATAPRAERVGDEPSRIMSEWSAAPPPHVSPAARERSDIDWSEAATRPADIAPQAAPARSARDDAPAISATPASVAAAGHAAPKLAPAPSEAPPPVDSSSAPPRDLRASGIIASARPATQIPPSAAALTEPGEAAEPALAEGADSLPIVSSLPARQSIAPPASDAIALATAATPRREAPLMRFDAPEPVVAASSPPDPAPHEASATHPAGSTIVGGPIALDLTEADAPDPMAKRPTVTEAHAALFRDDASGDSAPPAARSNPSAALPSSAPGESARPAPADAATRQPGEAAQARRPTHPQSARRSTPILSPAAIGDEATAPRDNPSNVPAREPARVATTPIVAKPDPAQTSIRSSAAPLHDASGAWNADRPAPADAPLASVAAPPRRDFASSFPATAAGAERRGAGSENQGPPVGAEPLPRAAARSALVSPAGSTLARTPVGTDGPALNAPIAAPRRAEAHAPEPAIFARPQPAIETRGASTHDGGATSADGSSALPPPAAPVSRSLAAVSAVASFAVRSDSDGATSGPASIFTVERPAATADNPSLHKTSSPLARSIPELRAEPTKESAATIPASSVTNPTRAAQQIPAPADIRAAQATPRPEPAVATSGLADDAKMDAQAAAIVSSARPEATMRENREVGVSPTRDAMPPHDALSGDRIGAAPRNAPPRAANIETADPAPLAPQRPVADRPVHDANVDMAAPLRAAVETDSPAPDPVAPPADNGDHAAAPAASAPRRLDGVDDHRLVQPITPFHVEHEPAPPASFPADPASAAPRSSGVEPSSFTSPAPDGRTTAAPATETLPAAEPRPQDDKALLADLASARPVAARAAEPLADQPSSTSPAEPVAAIAPKESDSVSDLLRSLRSFAAGPTREARAVGQRPATANSAARSDRANIDGSQASEASAPPGIDAAPFLSAAEPRRAQAAPPQPRPAARAASNAAPARPSSDMSGDPAATEEEAIAAPSGRIDLAVHSGSPAPTMADPLAGQARTSAPAGAFAPRPGAAAATQAVSSAASAQRAAASPEPNAIEDDAIAAQPVGRIDLSGHSGSPAPALAALLAPQARALIAEGRPVDAPTEAAAATRAAVDVAPRSGAAAKTLTIELAPESLGAVVVKMKIAHSGVDMKISVRSQEALHKLETSRSALVDAMQAAGCSIDGCTIQIASAPAPDAKAQDGGGFFASPNGAEADHGGRGVAEEGTSDGQGSGARRRDAARDDGAADGAPRRPADRRGGGVYL